MKYLTPAQYVDQVDDGMPLSDVSALTLARTIGRAESDVDADMGFDLRLGGFEPHTGWFQQQWDARTLKTRVPNFPVPVRQVLAYKIQVSNLTTSGAGFMAILNSHDIALNTFEHYVEAVPLQSITYSLAPVMLQLSLRPPILQVDYEAGYFLSSLGEMLIDSGNSTLYYAARGFWATSYTQSASIQPATLPPVPPVVYKNGVAQFTAVLSAALSAGIAYTSLPVLALTATVNAGTVLTLNDGSGGTGITVTVAGSGAAPGTTSIPITSFTPVAPYGVGTIFASGYSVNYTEGQVIFSVTNARTDLIKADYTYTIPDNVRDATILQTTYLLGERALNKLGMQGIELARSGDQQLRRHMNADSRGDGSVLCAGAAYKLSVYKSIAIA